MRPILVQLDADTVGTPSDTRGIRQTQEAYGGTPLALLPRMTMKFVQRSIPSATVGSSSCCVCESSQLDSLYIQHPQPCQRTSFSAPTVTQ